MPAPVANLLATVPAPVEPPPVPAPRAADIGPAADRTTRFGTVLSQTVAQSAAGDAATAAATADGAIPARTFDDDTETDANGIVTDAGQQIVAGVPIPPPLPALIAGVAEPGGPTGGEASPNGATTRGAAPVPTEPSRLGVPEPAHTGPATPVGQPTPALAPVPAEVTPAPQPAAAATARPEAPAVNAAPAGTTATLPATGPTVAVRPSNVPAQAPIVTDLTRSPLPTPPVPPAEPGRPPVAGLVAAAGLPPVTAGGIREPFDLQQPPTAVGGPQAAGRFDAALRDATEAVETAATGAADRPAPPPVPLAAAAEPPAAATPTPIATPTPSQAVQVADGIVAHARLLAKDGDVEFRLRLDPPDLGRIQIHLVSAGDELRAHVLVSDDAVRRMIESQLPELRQRLEAAGVTVRQFDVSQDPNPDGRSRREWAAPEPPAPANPYHPAPPRAAATVGGPAGRLDVRV